MCTYSFLVFTSLDPDPDFPVSWICFRRIFIDFIPPSLIRIRILRADHKFKSGSAFHWFGLNFYSVFMAGFGTYKKFKFWNFPSFGFLYDSYLWYRCTCLYLNNTYFYLTRYLHIGNFIFYDKPKNKILIWLKILNKKFESECGNKIITGILGSEIRIRPQWFQLKPRKPTDFETWI